MKSKTIEEALTDKCIEIGPSTVVPGVSGAVHLPATAWSVATRGAPDINIHAIDTAGKYVALPIKSVNMEWRGAEDRMVVHLVMDEMPKPPVDLAPVAAELAKMLDAERAKVASLDRELADARHELQARESEVGRLNDAVYAAEDSMLNARRALDYKEQRIRKLEGELEAMRGSA